MWAQIKVLDPTAKEPNWDAWANDMRLMREQDKRTHRDACELFGWATRDSFWHKNILSPSKLRAKWQQLALARTPAAGKPAGARGLSDAHRQAADAVSDAGAMAIILAAAGQQQPNTGDVIDATT